MSRLVKNFRCLYKKPFKPADHVTWVEWSMFYLNSSKIIKTLQIIYELWWGSQQCTMGKIGLLNVTQKYFIPKIISFGTTLKINYLLYGYSYWRINYIFMMTTKLTLMQQFLTLFNPILAKWPSFAHSAMSPCTQAKTRSPNQLLG